MNGYCLRFTLAWLLSVVVGCTSAPVRYYTLAAPPDRTLPASETTLSIDVRVVHTPPQLNRSELMVRTGPTEVTLLENERWASPELGRYVLFEASWSATSSSTGQRSDEARATNCTFQADEKIHTGYAGIVEGYQREIAALADAIVEVLTSPASGIDASCQKSIEGSAGGSGPKDSIG